MNDKDKEAFKKWFDKLYSDHVEFRDWQGCDIAVDGKEDMRYGWQAACEYKQKEIDEYKEAARSEAALVNELQAENAKLKEHLLIATNLIRATRPNDGLKK